MVSGGQGVQGELEPTGMRLDTSSHEASGLQGHGEHIALLVRGVVESYS